MKELDFIKHYKKRYACGVDESKSLDIYPLLKEKHPFKVKYKDEELGCLYLHYEWSMQPPMVWVMYLKSYNDGNGTQILKLLCQLADEEGITLYLEPAPDNGGKLNQAQLVSWYRRYGFSGEATMVRLPKKR